MDAVVHFEIPAEKLARAQKFYSDVFDWKIQKWPVPGSDMEYYGCHTTEVDEKMMPKKQGEINGAIIQKDPTAPGPIITMNVKDIDESLEKIRQAGGEIVGEKLNIAGMGIYARAKDTEGNVISVWQAWKME